MKKAFFILFIFFIFTAIVYAEETVPNPLGFTTFGQLAEIISKAALTIGSVLAVLFIIWAGFLFVTARGNEEQIKQARSTFTWTVIGIAVLFGAYVIATAVVEFFKGL